MDKKELYNSITDRKRTTVVTDTYSGDNGRINNCVEYVRTFIKTNEDSHLLDVGGSRGDLCVALRDKFKHSTLIDISKKFVEDANTRKINAYECDVDKDGLVCVIDESIDFIAALDFIEHIIDPEYFARECFRVAKPGAKVYINTPNIQYWEHICALLYGSHFPHTSGDKEVFHGGHLAFFTYNDLVDIFSAAGFINFKQLNDMSNYSDAPREFDVIARRKEDYSDINSDIVYRKKFCNKNIIFTCEKSEW